MNGFRIIPFDDPELPGYNAVRTVDDLERLRKNASEFAGPIISLQHVPLIETDKNPCREHFTNADEIIAMIRNINGGIICSFRSGRRNKLRKRIFISCSGAL